MKQKQDGTLIKNMKFQTIDFAQRRGTMVYADYSEEIGEARFFFECSSVTKATELANAINLINKQKNLFVLKQFED